MKDFIDTVIGLMVIWFFFKLFTGMNLISFGSRSNSSSKRGYFVKGTYHKSGTVHTYHPDALKECEEMKKKYPEDVFYVHDTEF